MEGAIPSLTDFICRHLLPFFISFPFFKAATFHLRHTLHSRFIQIRSFMGASCIAAFKSYMQVLITILAQICCQEVMHKRCKDLCVGTANEDIHQTGSIQSQLILQIIQGIISMEFIPSNAGS